MTNMLDAGDVLNAPIQRQRALLHAGTVVPECFKDDNASQWKSGKFDPRSLRNP